MQTASLPTPPPETPPPSGGVYPQKHFDFATLDGHSIVPTEWSEVVNDNAVTPPKLIKENDVSQPDPLAKNEIQWQLETQLPPTPPASTASNSPVVTAAPIGVIRPEKKTRK